MNGLVQRKGAAISDEGRAKLFAMLRDLGDENEATQKGNLPAGRGGK